MSTMIQYFKVLEVNERKDKRMSKNKSPSNKSRNKNQQSSSDEEASAIRGKSARQGKASKQSGPPVRTSSRMNPSGKWCDIHKSTSHNTSECRAKASQSQDSPGAKSQESNAIETDKSHNGNRQANKRKPKEEVHQLSEEDSTSGSEASEDHFVINEQLGEGNRQGIPRCDLKLVIRGPNGKLVPCRALLDSGSSKTIVEGTALLESAEIPVIKAPIIHYSTKKGQCSTNKQATVQATFPVPRHLKMRAYQSVYLSSNSHSQNKKVS